MLVFPIRARHRLGKWRQSFRVELGRLWADHHTLYVREMEVKKVAVLLCQEWHTSPCWSLKALEELLLIGELIRPDSLLPPLF